MFIIAYSSNVNFIDIILENKKRRPDGRQNGPASQTGMVHRIVTRFDPERIILFGSQATGTAGKDSDVDLLIVMPFEGLRLQKQLELRILLHDVPVPKDVVVTALDEFAWRKDVVGTIEWPAAREGNILYARS